MTRVSPTLESPDPQSLLIHLVDNGRRMPMRHSARIGGYWYFIDRQKLARISEQELAAPGAGLDKAEEVATPSGALKGVLGFKDRVVIAVSEPAGRDCRLYFSSPDRHDWQESCTIHGWMGNWCRDPAGKYAFFVTDPVDKTRPESRDILVSEDGEHWRVFERIWRPEAEHVHNICLVGQHLLVLVGDAHFNHFSITVADGEGNLLQDPADRRRQPLGLSHRSLFRVLPRPGGGLAYALDGATELYGADGSFWQSDYADGASGCQVAAHLHFPWLPDILFLGTWRRSATHPYPCLYLLSPEATAKHIEDSRPFTEDLAWCGFQRMESTLSQAPDEAWSVQFWPCHGGKSLCFVPLSQARAQALQTHGIPRLQREQLDRRSGELLRLPSLPFILECGAGQAPWRP